MCKLQLPHFIVVHICIKKTKTVRSQVTKQSEAKQTQCWCKNCVRSFGCWLACRSRTDFAAELLQAGRKEVLECRWHAFLNFALFKTGVFVFPPRYIPSLFFKTIFLSLDKASCSPTAFDLNWCCCAQLSIRTTLSNVLQHDAGSPKLWLTVVTKT